jgi:hypothetical protein
MVSCIVYLRSTPYRVLNPFQADQTSEFQLWELHHHPPWHAEQELREKETGDKSAFLCTEISPGVSRGFGCDRQGRRRGYGGMDSCGPSTHPFGRKTIVDFSVQVCYV